jgi:hypothetical protein
MGRGAGEFLRSAHWAAFYRDLLSLNNTVREHLDDVPLPEKRFCFATCLGEVYLFFDANGRDDPTIWYWNERIDPGVRKAYDSLWDWLEEMVEDYERCWRPRKVERRRVPSAR